MLAPEITGHRFEDPFHKVPLGNSLAVNSNVEGKSKTNIHCLVIHHPGLVSRNGVLLWFILPPRAYLPGSGVSFHQVCTTHRSSENQWKYLLIDKCCFSKSRLALLLAIFDTASFKMLALAQECGKAQQDHTKKAPHSLQRRLGSVATSQQPRLPARPELTCLPPSTSMNTRGFTVQ